jgi:ankyrin repeat protein
VPGLDPVWVWRKHEVARVLIEHGTPYDIYSAAGLDDLPRVRKLVTGDAEALSRPGEGGMTPLHWAARNNAGKVTSWLLKRKVDPDEVNLAQRTAMHQAADWNHTDMLWLLAGAGADVDAPDTSGRTPLHRAMFLGRVEAAEVLILLEADTRTGDLSGRTPLDIARQGCLFLQRGR